MIESVKCPDCGGEMVSRSGQYGVFWGCKKFPSCKGTRDNQGRSKADRAQYKRQKAIERGDGEILEELDKEVDKYDLDNGQKITFNKK